MPAAMQMIYNSPLFCVVEFVDATPEDGQALRGFEIVDKSMRREIFLHGADADRFRADVTRIIEQGEPDVDVFDAFLDSYSGLMSQPVTLH
jgi:hypothetical protein